MMNELYGKKVVSIKWDRIKGEYVDDIKGKFIAFGLQGEYSDSASLVYSSAIIFESITNKLYNIPVENIRFIEEV